MKSANGNVAKESEKSRRALSKEVRKPTSKPVGVSASKEEPKPRETEQEAPVFVKIPLAPESKSPSATGVKKSDLDGFAG